MLILYILVIISLIIAFISMWKESRWKASMLQELKDINICAFSANQTNVELLDLARRFYDEYKGFDFVVLEEEEEDERKISDR